MQSTTPPQTGMAPSARLVPPPRTVMGNSNSFASFTIAAISSGPAGWTAASGMWK